MRNYPRLYLVNINAYLKLVKFYKIIERKRNYDGLSNGRTDRMTDNPNPI